MIPDLRRFFFRFRGYTPLPFIILAILGAQPRFVPACGGLVSVLLGEWMRIWGVSYAGSMTRSRNIQVKRLITDGPYAYMRHPLYVGNFLLSVGCCMIAWAWMPWMVFALIIAFGLQYGLIVSLEEEELHRRFGQEYTTYSLHVPKFFPRWSPYRGVEMILPDFKGALRSERPTLTTVTVLLILLIIRRMLM
jgi:protein-S-isoprenylcysteine O-methyltransferase Ste14